MHTHMFGRNAWSHALGKWKSKFVRVTLLPRLAIRKVLPSCCTKCNMEQVINMSGTINPIY